MDLLTELLKSQAGRGFGVSSLISYVWCNKPRSREFEMIFVLFIQIRFSLGFTKSEIIPAVVCCDNVL